MVQNPFEAIDERLRNIENILLDLKNTPKETGNNIEADQLLNIKLASELLSLSIPTIYSKVSKCELPVCKKGNRLYFSKQELLKWIREGRKKTIAETAIEAAEYTYKKTTRKYEKS